ncbi:MAG: dihydrolipoyl dehydrogenase [Bdellovibrionales bacterium]|nr:dihydrolipoyl dehydrogenase [Bdellovibrionales bacterium]MBT3526650.1 dihydrolipoyl dehydrogenase [Bdellovibrionales bacterium]
MKKMQVVVIGSGPGGHIAAIRASQLGHNVTIIEQDKLGGVCLNRGCIPTKALLTSAHAALSVKEMKGLGVNVTLESLDGSVAVKRSAQIAQRLSKGVQFLIKRGGIELVKGRALFSGPQEVTVNDSQINFDRAIIATGAHPRTFPGLEFDGKRLLNAYQALALEQLPTSIGIVGAGAIGVEFAYFWNAFGVKVHIFEMLDHLLPVEDLDASKEIERAYRRLGIKTSLGVKEVRATNHGEQVTISCQNSSGVAEEFSFDQGLIAVGMSGNIENLGLESVGVTTERGFININDNCQTSCPNIYAIGDVAGPPLLAHLASHQGVVAAEHLSGLTPHAIDYDGIPGCTYCSPQVASVGATEQQLKEQGVNYHLGKLPMMANGKALAMGQRDGFVKVLLGDHGELLGAHLVGEQASEMLGELLLYRSMEGVTENMINTIHPHPTMGEWIPEAVMAAFNRSLST